MAECDEATMADPDEARAPDRGTVPGSAAPDVEHARSAGTVPPRGTGPRSLSLSKASLSQLASGRIAVDSDAALNQRDAGTVPHSLDTGTAPVSPANRRREVWSGSAAVPSLVVREVAVELGGRLVLEHTGLSIDHGELVGLIGPNGAGKTTLLRTILGVQPTVAGEVTVEGRQARPGVTPIGYVPQRHEFAWEFPISVADTVMTGLTRQLGLFRRPSRAAWEAVADALDRVRMTHLAGRPIGQLSGGQRQRVLVARALALRPVVLLLDEPFSGLDMPAQELLTELFTDLAREGRAVLMATHDLAGALYSCDRIALLNRTVVATGTPSALAADPSAWTATFGVDENSALLRILKAA